MDMTPLAAAHERTVTWVRPEDGRATYTLFAGDDVVATLAWDDLDGAQATGATAEGRWTFARQGVLHPRLTAHLIGAAGAREAVFVRTGAYDGLMTLPDGRTFAWRHHGLWHSTWDVVAEAGGRVLRVTELSGHAGHRARLETGPVAVPPADLALLALLSWYDLILMSRTPVGIL